MLSDFWGRDLTDRAKNRLINNGSIIPIVTCAPQPPAASLSSAKELSGTDGSNPLSEC